MPLKVGLLSGLSSQHIFIRSIYGAGALSGGTWGLQCGLIPFRMQKSISKQLKKIQSLNKIAHCELIKKQDFRIVPFSSESTIARLNGPKAASIQHLSYVIIHLVTEIRIPLFCILEEERYYIVIVERFAKFEKFLMSELPLSLAYKSVTTAQQANLDILKLSLKVRCRGHKQKI